MRSVYLINFSKYNCSLTQYSIRYHWKILTYLQILSCIRKNNPPCSFMWIISVKHLYDWKIKSNLPSAIAFLFTRKTIPILIISLSVDWQVRQVTTRGKIQGNSRSRWPSKVSRSHTFAGFLYNGTTERADDHFLENVSTTIPSDINWKRLKLI